MVLLLYMNIFILIRLSTQQTTFVYSTIELNWTLASKLLCFIFNCLITKSNQGSLKLSSNNTFLPIYPCVL